MSQPRRDNPADGPEVDRVREALRYHDERLEQDHEETQPDTDQAREPDAPREGEEGGRAGQD